MNKTQIVVLIAVLVLSIVAIIGVAALFIDYWLRRHLDRNDDGIIDEWEEANPPPLPPPLPKEDD